MKKETGNPEFDIWLLGDSNPRNWQSVLETPLDPRHPARHNIWTPVLEAIQDKVFRACRIRLDTSSLFIRNAIEDPGDKPPSRTIEWGTPAEREVAQFQQQVRERAPRIVLSFGAFSFEFARRAITQERKRNFGHWGARELGREFRQRIAQFNIDDTNLLPLLHASIARGRFIQSHEYFCGQEGANYFDFVGDHIAQKLIEHRDRLDIWIA